MRKVLNRLLCGSLMLSLTVTVSVASDSTGSPGQSTTSPEQDILQARTGLTAQQIAELAGRISPGKSEDRSLVSVVQVDHDLSSSKCSTRRDSSAPREEGKVVAARAFKRGSVSVGPIGPLNNHREHDLVPIEEMLDVETLAELLFRASGIGHSEP